MNALRKSWAIISFSLLLFSQAYGALPRGFKGKAAEPLGQSIAAIRPAKPASGLLAPLPEAQPLPPQGPESRVLPPSPAVAYLKSLDKIRVYFANAPGYGHQMATLSIVRRLRELGFKGKIEGVYDAGRAFDGVMMPTKLGQLIPDFKPYQGDDVQKIQSLGMTMRSFESFSKKGKRVPLALTGGDDHIKFNMTERFKADVFLGLAPFDWQAYEEKIWIKGKTGPMKIKYGNNPVFVYAPARERIDAGYFADLYQANVPKRKADGLALLHREIGQHELLAAYGLHFFNAAMLHRLLLGISDSMDRSPNLYPRRGVVIPLLLDIENKIIELQDCLRHPKLNDDGLLGRILHIKRLWALKAANARLRERVQIASITDRDLGEKLRRLKKNGILILKTGTVPPAVFEFLFAHSTLPPTLEGSNAINLARLLGIPFLPVNSLAFEGLRSADAKTRAKKGLFLSGQYDLKYKSDDYDFEHISAYISAAMTPDSPLRRMFSAGKIRQDDYTQDKLISAVEFALPRLKAAKP